MSLAEVLCIAFAGLAAGTINTVVGSGTLITFPVLLAFGYAPVTANVSNTIGLVPGSISGAIGYRRELRGQGRRALRLGSMSVLGGITGAVLLLVLPSSAFKAIVPVFIAIALVLTVMQPRIRDWLARREIDLQRDGHPLTALAIYLTGVYGGYFGAAQGIMLLAILGVVLAQDLHRTNALKNVLAGLVNGVAGLYFVFAAHVDWGPAAIIAGSAIVGGQLGARYGRKLPPGALRALIVVVGVSAIVQLIVG
ncbi:MAG TPA: sulfite exporter TauE/SafE family protein [Solirubrobacteraceae bacterium]|nr:sulfite exporter TauE/SafE family protein [Solirubrobacteraceae bacterium]